MSKKHQYQRLPDTTTVIDLPHQNFNTKGMRRNSREFIHHRSVLFGIFIGLAFAIITLLTLLPSLSINYFDTQQTTSSDDTNTLFTTFAGSASNRYARHHRKDNNAEDAPSDTTLNLYNNVRILCLIFTYEENYKEKAYWLNQTWGKRCNKLLFMSNITDPNNLIDVTVLNITESRDELWGKTKATFKYAYEHHLNDFDWFLKADDDTYIIMENLRYFLYPYPTDLPLYFGFEFQPQYMSGGAGYLLSREAVKLFIEKGLPNPNKCSQENVGVEDLEIGRCLEGINVTVGDTRDELGRERFFPITLDFLLDAEKSHDETYWYFSMSKYEHKTTGLQCCSNTAISFHYMNRVNFLMFEYLLYNLKLHKREISRKELPIRYSKEDVNIMFKQKNIGLNPVNSSNLEFW